MNFKCRTGLQMGTHATSHFAFNIFLHIPTVFGTGIFTYYLVDLGSMRKACSTPVQSVVSGIQARNHTYLTRSSSWKHHGKPEGSLGTRPFPFGPGPVLSHPFGVRLGTCHVHGSFPVSAESPVKTPTSPASPRRPARLRLRPRRTGSPRVWDGRSGLGAGWGG